MKSQNLNKITFKFVKEHKKEQNCGGKEKAIITVPDQIIILIDGKNEFENEGLGMIPQDFFSQDKLFYNGELQIGICGCSCYQCADTFVSVKTDSDMVIWTTKDWSKGEKSYINDKTYYFDEYEYTEIINRYKNKYADNVFNENKQSEDEIVKILKSDPILRELAKAVSEEFDEKGNYIGK